ncbi:unnamed protein product [Echinostoma caproni]|uniref:RT_RNaseH domain-containing protein n=1 Tax=Echinostoma caproni TaxID=27848 RepID=A0A183A662_9TREM|nr:unnamed protein product [Echinostoma caproni]
MELATIEQLNLQENPTEIEEWVERFELWCSIRKGGVQNQSALILNAGGRDLSTSSVHTSLQRLIVKFSNNTRGMNAQPANLEVDSEPIFLERREIPYGQREGVLETLEKMERNGVTTRITSNVDIGAILEQNGCPIVCIFRLLNNSERGYSQTQKEALAVYWAVRRLHKYLFELRFTIVTDHQAL